MANVVLSARISADISSLEAGLVRADASLRDFSKTATAAGGEAAKGMSLPGAAAEKTAAQVAVSQARMAELWTRSGAAQTRAAELGAQAGRLATESLTLEGKAAQIAAEKIGGLSAASQVAAASAESFAARAAQTATALDATAAAGARASAGMSALGAVGMAAAGLTILDGLAVKVAISFQAMTQTIANNTTMTTAELGNMRQSVLDLSRGTGTSFQSLAEGYMHVSNFGFAAADAQKVLTEANKSAVATGSDAAQTADILAKGLHEYGLSADYAGRVMNVFHLAAAQGNMTLQQFDAAMGPTIGAAANLGVSLADVAAAETALTQHGQDAFEASTQLKSILEHIVNPTAEASKALTVLGNLTGIDLVKDFSLAGLHAKGLNGVMADLSRATQGHSDIVLKLIPAMRGGYGAMILAGTGARDYRHALLQANDAMAGKIDPTSKAYNETMQTAAQRFKALTQSIQVDLLPAGNRLLGTLQSLEPAAANVANAVTTVVDVFSRFPAPVQEVIIALGAAKVASSLFGLSLLGVDGKMGGVVMRIPAMINGLRGIETAAGSAAVAEGALATEGIAAFAIGGGFMIAIAAVAVAVLAIANAWNKAKDAQAGYAKHKAEVVAYVNTGDQRTNEQHQAELNNQQAGKVHAAIVSLQNQENTKQLALNPLPKGSEVAHGLQGQIADLAHQIAVKTAQETALRRDASALGGSLANTSDLQNTRSNIQGEVKKIDGTIGTTQASLTGLENKLSVLKASIAAQKNNQLAQINLAKQIADVQGQITSDESALAALKKSRHEQVANYNKLEPLARQETKQKWGAGMDAGTSIMNHITDAINTPQGKASCAYFASELMRASGVAVPLTGGAKALKEWAVGVGAVAHSLAEAKAGDLIAWHGKRYGAMKDKNGEGDHVGIYAGNGMIRQSSGNGPGHDRMMHMYDAPHAQFYTVPDSAIGGKVAKALDADKFNAALKAKGDDAAKQHQGFLGDTFSLNNTEFATRRHDAQERFDGSDKGIAAKKWLAAQMADINKDEVKAEQEQSKKLKAEHDKRVKEALDASSAIAKTKRSLYDDIYATTPGKGGKLPSEFDVRRRTAHEDYGDHVQALVSEKVKPGVARGLVQPWLAGQMGQIGRDEKDARAKQREVDARAQKPGVELLSDIKKIGAESQAKEVTDPGEAAWQKFVADHAEGYALIAQKAPIAARAHMDFLKAFAVSSASDQAKENLKTLAKFHLEMTDKMIAVRSKVTDAADPALAAWHEYLATHDDVVKAIGKDAGAAAQAFAQFRAEFVTEQDAQTLEQYYQQMSRIHQQMLETQARTPEEKMFAQTLQSDGTGGLKQAFSSDQIKNMATQQKQLGDMQAKVQQTQAAWQSMSGVVQSGLDHLMQRGFNGFFANVVQGFRGMFRQIAVEYLRNEAMQAMQRGLSGILNGKQKGGGATGGVAAAAQAAQGAQLAGAATALTAAGTGLAATAGVLTASGAGLTGAGAGLLGASAGLVGGGTGLVAAAAALVAAAAASSASSAMLGISGARADGGSVIGGNRYLVGERGPEIVTMGGNGFVTPNHQIRTASAGAGGGGDSHFHAHVTVQGNGSADANRRTGQQVGQAAMAEMQRAQRRNGV